MVELSGASAAVVTGGDAQVKTGAGRVLNFHASADAGNEWKLYDGTDATGTLIGHFAGGSVGQNGPWVVPFATGLFVEDVGGAGFLTLLYE